MGRTKKTVGEILLTGNTRKLSRAQLSERAAEEKSSGVSPHKIAQAEKMYLDIFERRETAQADVRKRGAVLRMVRYSAKGNRYTVEAPNPNLKICQQCERALMEISRFVTSAKPAPDKSTEETREEDDFAEFIARGPQARLRSESRD